MGGDTGRLELEPGRAEERAERPAPDLDRQHTAVGADRRPGERRGDGGLADAALAGHDDETLGGERQPGRHAQGS